MIYRKLFGCYPDDMYQSFKDLKEHKKSLNPEEIDNLREEIPETTEVNFSSLIQGIIINPEMFDPYWNNYNDESKGELRGGKEYALLSEYYDSGLNV